MPPPRPRTGKGICDGLEEIAAMCGGQLVKVTPALLLQENPPPIYYATDLPHDTLDEVNSLKEAFRKTDGMRDLFEILMRDHTYEDEPNAPLIKLQNPHDDQATPPWEFHYSNNLWLGEGVPPPDFSALKGCDCDGDCAKNAQNCACYKRNRHYATLVPDAVRYEDWPYEGEKKGKKGEEAKPKTMKNLDYPIWECNALCGCPESCINRVSYRCCTEAQET